MTIAPLAVKVGSCRFDACGATRRLSFWQLSKHGAVEEFGVFFYPDDLVRTTIVTLSKVCPP